MSYLRKNKNMMKQTVLFILAVFLFASCSTTTHLPSSESYQAQGHRKINESEIIQSLFTDNTSTISEENIQNILNGTYKLPEKLRVAVVKLESKQYQRMYYWTNEDYLKTQQFYLDLFSDKLKMSQRVGKISVIPDLLLSNQRTFVNIREAAVRTQADVVAVFTINSEIYSKYKLFSATDIKAFATTQFILLDVRTGLIPFSTTVTKDYQSQKQKADFDDSVAISRVKNEAVLLTIDEIGRQVSEFLDVEEANM